MSRVRGALGLLAATMLIGAAAGAAGPSDSAAQGTLLASGLTFQPQLGAPGLNSLLGASPGEAPGEVWGIGNIGALGELQVGQESVLLRRSQGTAWQVVPVVDGQGNPLNYGGTPKVTNDGGVVMLSAQSGGGKIETVITRDRGAAFARALPPADAVLDGAKLGSEPPFAAIDDPGHTGALVVPTELSQSAPAVLHYNGASWEDEPICATYESGHCASATGLSVLAIAAASPQKAWLLARGPDKPLALFQMAPGGGSGSGSVWVQVWAPASAEVLSLREGRQLLTATDDGVWVDLKHEQADVSLLLDDQAPTSAPATVRGRWCYAAPGGCPAGEGSLGAPLPDGEYASFATSAGGLGTRIISGLPGGALLRFRESGDFEYVVGVSGSSNDAAFSPAGESLEEGWLAGVSSGRDGAKIERVSTSPEPTLGRQAWPLPFRRPMLAIAPQPGTSAGDPNAQALAVGDQGQIARYEPGVGWTPEFLYNAAGLVQRPRLRGVAWPEPGRAYAVGDEGAMWLWRGDTGLWEADPAAPLDLHADLTAIAFSPLDPAVGYAVGKQGALLRYDKTWTQQALPPGFAQADFTAIAFAGNEALASYRMVCPATTTPSACPESVKGSAVEVGGLLVENGGGWEVDSSAESLLGRLPAAASVLSKVAGLPDGGAVAAGPGVVIERDSASSAWRFSHEPLSEAQNVSALAAFRAGSEVRALLSIDLVPESNPNEGLFLNIDELPPSALGQPFPLVGPDPLPATGYLLRETAEGWQDLEQQAYPAPATPGVKQDLPAWPDAVLALDVDQSGGAGWAVGGQTGGQFLEGSGGTELQSALALRLGSGPSPPQHAGAPIGSRAEQAEVAEQATFAVGGNAQCEGPCVNLLNEGLGPDAWLTKALAGAAAVPGVRGFLYTGARVAEGDGSRLDAEGFTRELRAYRDDLAAAGSLPVHVAASPSDLYEGSLATFSSVLGPYAGAAEHPAGPAPPPGTGAYAFDSPGRGGTVRVVVLDFAQRTLAAGELGWLVEQLAAAKAARVPAIVMGNAGPISGDANAAADAGELDLVLLRGGASAYVFDSPNQNRYLQIGSGSNAIPAFGTGTLGYVPITSEPQEFLGASGYLLVSVGNAAHPDPHTNRAPVSAKLIPSIDQLALDATDGTLLRRSQVALFEGLARRPAGGFASVEKQYAPDPYVPIPETCVGSGCGHFVAPSYTFHSSEEDVGDFVEPEPGNLNPRAVRQGSGRLPIHDELSGLFCAYNAGTTTVSITTGGLTYSEQVTVQAGSVQQPCGTVPLKNPPPAPAAAHKAVPAPPSTPPASSPAPLAVVPAPPPVALVPAAPAAAPRAPRPAPPPPAPPFFVNQPLVASLVALPPPPPPQAARPIPPSGTSLVTQPAIKTEEEEEEAPESASANMTAYNHEGLALPTGSLLALALIAAAAGTGIRRARRSRRRAPALARARGSRQERPW